ncbi:MAG: hypothetical protein GWM98_07705, partial [Nitrospinaceae bacterium]|nr:hypothetical protein [Nitrospinaceae bacterium]
MTSKAETDDAAVKAGDGETTPAVEAATSSANQQLFIQAGAFTVPENAYSLRRLIMKALTQA